jgi:putative FmdB family regulatory protein
VKYDYRCKVCGNIQEVKHGMSEEPEVVCSACGSTETKKYLGNTTMKFILKGPGFYSTENALKAIGAPQAVRDSAFRNKVL